MNLKNNVLSSISAAFLGIACTANAADLTTMAEIRTSVIEPTSITAQYSPTESLMAGQMERGKIFGNLDIRGYKADTAFGHLKLSDNAGGTNLILKDKTNPNNTLEYTVVYEGPHGDVRPVINNQPSSSPSEILPANNVYMSVKLASTQNNLPAGEYTGMLNISIANQ